MLRASSQPGRSYPVHLTRYLSYALRLSQAEGVWRLQVDVGNDFERTKSLMVELSGGSIGGDVASVEPYLVAGKELGSWDPMVVGVACVPVLGSGDFGPQVLMDVRQPAGCICIARMCGFGCFPHFPHFPHFLPLRSGKCDPCGKCGKCGSSGLLYPMYNRCGICGTCGSCGICGVASAAHANAVGALRRGARWHT